MTRFPPLPPPRPPMRPRVLTADDGWHIVLLFLLAASLVAGWRATEARTEAALNVDLDGGQP